MSWDIQDGVGFKLHLRIKQSVSNRFFEQSTSGLATLISDDITRQLSSSESFLSGLGEGAFRSLGGAFKGVSKLVRRRSKRQFWPHAIRLAN